MELANGSHRSLARALALVVAAAASLAPGCRKEPGWQEREVDHGLVHLDLERANLRHDRVGHDQWASRATFALLDAHNRHTSDLLVTLGGVFVDDRGRTVGRATTQSLRIPAGGVRTFALVDDAQTERPTARSVRAQVLGAHAPDYPPPIQVTDGRVYRDGDRVVANAMIRNTAPRPGYAIVIAGFYDAEGRPLTRPFTSMYLPAAGSHPAEFVGPPGSVKAYVFIGDMKY